ncbi:hypothetical protein [Alicyclobacillus fodiniaquatilis]|jgi:hypothetical protein|uniref:Uncharacterized protein n=1 Tax=Alicyclobacillus fodiniaquatilis TaxID=1661150 RepID=A0ABW4JAV7_9BACL
MSNSSKIVLALSSVLSLYMFYLFWAWFAFQSTQSDGFFVVPFFYFRQFNGAFLSWINMVVIVNFLLWGVWLILFIRDHTRDGKKEDRTSLLYKDEIE